MLTWREAHRAAAPACAGVLPWLDARRMRARCSGSAACMLDVADAAADAAAAARAEARRAANADAASAEAHATAAAAAQAQTAAASQHGCGPGANPVVGNDKHKALRLVRPAYLHSLLAAAQSPARNRCVASAGRRK